VVRQPPESSETIARPLPGQHAAGEKHCGHDVGDSVQRLTPWDPAENPRRAARPARLL